MITVSQKRTKKSEVICLNRICLDRRDIIIICLTGNPVLIRDLVLAKFLRKDGM